MPFPISHSLIIMAPYNFAKWREGWNGKKEGKRYLSVQPNDLTYAEMMFEQIVACKRFLMINLSKNLKTAPLNSFDFFLYIKKLALYSASYFHSLLEAVIYHFIFHVQFNKNSIWSLAELKWNKFEVTFPNLTRLLFSMYENYLVDP